MKREHWWRRMAHHLKLSFCIRGMVDSIILLILKFPVTCNLLLLLCSIYQFTFYVILINIDFTLFGLDSDSISIYFKVWFGPALAKRVRLRIQEKYFFKRLWKFINISHSGTKSGGIRFYSKSILFINAYKG